MQKQPLIVLVGPTAVGKTSASIALAKKCNAEIISGDSMQIFKGFDIGTAKIKADEMEGIVHHLIDIKEPNDTFSAAEFRALVDGKIKEIADRGRIPLLVGGTGLYINSVIYDYNFGEAVEDKAYRALLQKEAEQNGNKGLYEQLGAVDPDSLTKIHLNDTKRIIRALEVYHVTKKPFSQSASGIDKSTLRYQTVYLALTMNREQLYQRINERVDQMLKEGWLDEVKELLANGADKKALAMQGLGYRQLAAYLSGDYSLERAVELIKRDTRHFAKRQLTWFRHDENICWVDKDHKSEEEVLAELLAVISRRLEI